MHELWQHAADVALQLTSSTVSSESWKFMWSYKGCRRLRQCCLHNPRVDRSRALNGGSRQEWCKGLHAIFFRCADWCLAMNI